MSFLSKYNEIKEGWKNYVFPSPEVEKIAEQRAVICAGCSSNHLSVCEKCGCPLISKTRSLKSKCPKDLWPNINIENEK